MKNHILHIEQFITKNYWTNWMGLSRSLMALSLMLTLVVNDKQTLFYSGLQNETFPKFTNITINLFSWFNNIQHGIICSILLLIPVLIGFLPRYTCIIHWIVSYSFFKTCIAIDGGDQVASIITFLLIPICIFDNRTWHWSTMYTEKKFIPKTIATFSYLLLIIQITNIYFFSAIGKFKVAEWVNGTAIYYWLQHPLFGAQQFYNPLLSIIFTNPILTAFLNWFVLLLELAIAVSIFWKNKTHRQLLLKLAILFHFLIAIFLGIVSFSITMIACLLLLLISKNNNYDLTLPYFNNSFSYIHNFLFFTTKKN